MGQQGPSPPPRAALHCRVSTADQSCERQERDLAALAERAGYEVVGTYKETASGVRADRAERRKVMALAQRREVDAVLVTELSRWGRSTTDLLATLRELETRRVSLVALNGMAFDLSTPHGRMMATLLAGVAEFERELTVERIRSGIAAAKARGKKLGRLHGQRPKSDRLAPKVLALVAQGRSYRLIGREVGLSKNTVAGIVKRSRTSVLAWLVLCLVGAPVWAQAPRSQAAPSPHVSDTASRTRRACVAISALADRGARAFRAADLSDRKVPIDLANDGHPQKVLRLDESGTAHIPYLADQAYQRIEGPQPDGYDEAARWATEVSVLRVGHRTWKVNWDAGRLDGTVALVAATDGTNMCRFHTTWQAPTLKLLPDAEPGRAGTYRALLAGRGSAPPTANLDPVAVQAASNLQGTWFSVPVQAPSWRVALLNAGQMLSLIRVKFASGAGRGCERNLLALVQDGRVIAGGLGRAWLPDRAPLAPASPALQQQLDQAACAGVTETPVIDRTRRAYVLFDNVATHPDTVDRVRLLAGARDGVIRALARLSSKARNVVLSPSSP